MRKYWDDISVSKFTMGNSFIWSVYVETYLSVALDKGMPKIITVFHKLKL